MTARLQGECSTTELERRVLCLGIEPSFQVHCLPVLTNRLPEVVVGVENFTYVPTLDIHPSTSYKHRPGERFWHLQRFPVAVLISHKEDVGIEPTKDSP